MVLKCHYSALLEYFNKYFAVDSPPPALENHTRDSCSGHFSSCCYHNWCFGYGLPPWSHGTHSSPLVWKIPWTEEPGGLQSMGSLSQTWLSNFTSTFLLSCIGEGNGNPPQCSCLENPRDGGAWWAAVYGVAQSRTRLKRLSSSSSSMVSVLLTVSYVGNNLFPPLHQEWNGHPNYLPPFLQFPALLDQVQGYKHPTFSCE